MLSKREYREFAQSINSAVSWNICTWHSVLLSIALVIAPPMYYWLEEHGRSIRTRKLISMIALYQHHCFRSESQKKSCCSLRVGVSPDSSLAYIDFLCNDMEANTRPLGPIGQPRLPIAFKFYGNGSYASPWQIDTNDTLLQAIGHCKEASVFIDEAWSKYACVDTMFPCNYTMLKYQLLMFPVTFAYTLHTILL